MRHCTLTMPLTLKQMIDQQGLTWSQPNRWLGLPETCNHLVEYPRFRGNGQGILLKQPSGTDPAEGDTFIVIHFTQPTNGGSCVLTFQSIRAFEADKGKVGGFVSSTGQETAFPTYTAEFGMTVATKAVPDGMRNDELFVLQTQQEEAYARNINEAEERKTSEQILKRIRQELATPYPEDVNRMHMLTCREVIALYFRMSASNQLVPAKTDMEHAVDELSPNSPTYQLLMMVPINIPTNLNAKQWRDTHAQLKKDRRKAWREFENQFDPITHQKIITHTSSSPSQVSPSQVSAECVQHTPDTIQGYLNVVINAKAVAKKQRDEQRVYDVLAEEVDCLKTTRDALNAEAELQNTEKEQAYQSVCNLESRVETLEQQLREAQQQLEEAKKTHMAVSLQGDEDNIKRRHSLEECQQDLAKKEAAQKNVEDHLTGDEFQYPMSVGLMDMLQIVDHLSGKKWVSKGSEGSEELQPDDSAAIILTALQQLIARGPVSQKRLWKKTKIHVMIQLIGLVALHLKKSPSFVLENLGLTRSEIESSQRLCIRDQSDFMQLSIKTLFGKQSRKASPVREALELLNTVYDLCQKMVSDDDDVIDGFPRILEPSSVDGFKCKEGKWLHLQCTTTQWGTERYPKTDAVYTLTNDSETDGAGIVVSKVCSTSDEPQRYVATGQIGTHRKCMKGLSRPVLSGSWWGACSCGCAGYEYDTGVSKARPNNNLAMYNDECQCRASRKDGEPFCVECA